jgi:cobalt/nickel transport system permease protein
LTHLHLPDGALPWWLWAPGLVVAAILLVVISRRHHAYGAERLALLATMSALMLAAMALPLGPLGYHLSLAPVVGMLLGAGLGFVAAAVVNVILALFGHGGITVIGLNALVVGTAAALGRWAFVWLMRRQRPFWAAATAALIAHLGAMAVFLLIVGVAGLAPNPGESELVAHGAEDLKAHTHAAREAGLRVGRFAALSIPFWIVGSVAEALVAGGIIGFLLRVKPTLIPDREGRTGEVLP